MYVFHNLAAIENTLNAIDLNNSFILILEYANTIPKGNIIFLHAYFITPVVTANSHNSHTQTDSNELFASSCSEVYDNLSSS